MFERRYTRRLPASRTMLRKWNLWEDEEGRERRKGGIIDWIILCWEKVEGEGGQG